MALPNVAIYLIICHIINASNDNQINLQSIIKYDFNI
jgi:hypothetical protein